MSSAYFAYTTRFYSEARGRIRERFAALSAAWPPELLQADPVKRIAFYGAGDVAEIGYVCLQETDLSVAAVFDVDSTRCFFGTPVRSIARLAMPSEWDDFHILVVMAFDAATQNRVREQLTAAHFPPDRIFWI